VQTDVGAADLVCERAVGQPPQTPPSRGLWLDLILRGASVAAAVPAHVDDETESETRDEADRSTWRRVADLMVGDLAISTAANLIVAASAPAVADQDVPIVQKQHGFLHQYAVADDADASQHAPSDRPERGGPHQAFPREFPPSSGKTSRWLKFFNRNSRTTVTTCQSSNAKPSARTTSKPFTRWACQIAKMPVAMATSR
jgi:hypothetical protein